jgi:hypothetical protein
MNFTDSILLVYDSRAEHCFTLIIEINSTHDANFIHYDLFSGTSENTNGIFLTP